MKDIKGKIYLFLGFALAGSSVISGRFVTGKLGPFTVTAVSLFFAIVFLLITCAGKLTSIKNLSPNDYILLILQALFGIFLFRMFLLNGLKLTSTGEAGILTGATPAVTAMLAMVILREQVKGRMLFGIFSTVAGILLIQGILSPDRTFTGNHFLGNLAVLCAASCESIFNIISRHFATKNKADDRPKLEPTVQTLVVSVIALIICLVPAMFEHPLRSLQSIGLKEWLSLIWYGVFVTALAFILWYSGIKRCGAFTAAAFSGMMPFTSMLLSNLVFGETGGLVQWIGGILVISGMILIGSSNISVSKLDTTCFEASEKCI